MGDFREDAHDKRSSNMTFALRWKHEKMRLIIFFTAISFAITFMSFMLLYGTAAKSVAVVVDDEETIVKTRSAVVEELLNEQGIQLGEHDRVTPALDAGLQDGDRIVIERAQPVLLTADGETKTLYTTEKTVSAALADWNVALSEDDKVYPSPDAMLTAGMSVQIVRVHKEIAEESVAIDFKTVVKEDASMPKGKQQVVQEGKEGEKIITKERVYEDGNMVSETVIRETVQSASVDKIVAVGTKAPAPTVKTASVAAAKGGETTKEGIQFSYQKVLKNVTLTAYTNGKSETGKSENDPGYGITASGTKTTEGRTIAVDKSVIPLGWWVYIEGIGYRRAEDTGSAVKGNKIDIFFENGDYASKFGVKRGYTVYVIGPKKPE